MLFPNYGKLTVYKDADFSGCGLYSENYGNYIFYFHFQNEPSGFDEYGFRIHPNDTGAPRFDQNVMNKLNQRIHLLYLEAVARGEKIQDQNFYDWALAVKGEIDPLGKLLFTASSGWLKNYLRRNNISLKEPKDGEAIQQPKELVESKGLSSRKGKVCLFNI